MSELKFEIVMEVMSRAGMSESVGFLRARDTAQRDALARVEAELNAKSADDLAQACIAQLIESGAENYTEHHFGFVRDGEDVERPAVVTVQFSDRPSPHELRIKAEAEHDIAQAQLAEAIKLLGWSKYQLMLWEDYQVENGFEVEDHYVTGKVREEVEAFLARHAQMPDMTAAQSAVISQRTREAYVAQADQQEARNAEVARESLRPENQRIEPVEPLRAPHPLEAQGAQAGEFQREDRYIVIKRKDLEAIERSGEASDLETHEAVRFLAEALDILRPHLPARECLVIESDWPEYEPTWAAIQERMTGQGAQPGDELVAKAIYDSDRSVFMSKREYAELHHTTKARLLKMARAALATRPAAEPVAEAWMPMETAPKDRRILVLRRQNTLQMPSYAAIAKWNAQPHHSNPKPYWDIEGLGLYVKEMRDNPPLGWMPLPQPALRGAEHE